MSSPATAPHFNAVIDGLRSVLAGDRSVTLEMAGDSLTVYSIDSNEQQRLIDLSLRWRIREAGDEPAR